MANAPSGDSQGRGEDRDHGNLHVGMMGDETEEQNLGQVGDPSARITADEVQEAFSSHSRKDPDVIPDDEAGQPAENAVMADRRDL